jgi:hypothetical protein
MSDDADPGRSAVSAVTLGALVVVTSLLSACGFREPGSWLMVHNRTTVPIVVVEQYNQSTRLVAACSSREFRIVGRGPAPEPPDDTGRYPPDAVHIPVSAVGAADASSHTVIVVSPEGVSTFDNIDPPSSLPPCEGTPPTPTPSAPAP